MSEIEKAIEDINKWHGQIKCGTALTAIQALEKQIPKKPAYTCNNEVIHCPNCDYDLMGGIEIDSESDPEYCWKCGQRLDWSENIE